MFDTHGCQTYDAANHAVPWPCPTGDTLQMGLLRHTLQEDAHMDSHDNFRERLEALEQQTEQWRQQTHTVERRLRWWRGLASGVLLVGLVSLPLPSGIAKEGHTEKDNRGLRQRVKLLEAQVNALEDKLAAVTFDPATKELVITGANLRIVNGLGSTNCTDDQFEPIPGCPNGLGNLIVGYNESRTPLTGEEDIRTGSHNVVVGTFHNFSRFGGMVVGALNEISGDFASVCGGNANTASGYASSVSGGSINTASSHWSSVSGGGGNTAGGVEFYGLNASVSGGFHNTASGDSASVSGGLDNTASGFMSSVSGGEKNTASGDYSSVSGGSDRSAPEENNWAAGDLLEPN